MFLVEKPFMQPHKDYDDYTKFINDTYSDKKTELLNQTFKLRRKSEVSQKYNPLESMRTYSEFADKEREFSRTTQGFYKAKTAKKGLAKEYVSETERAMGITFADFNVKPRILESNLAKRDDFFNLSDGFKKIFAADKKDKKLVLPIAGYGGHRRGDRSQNFFGKSFRESSIQSKKLQRDF